VSTSLKSTPPTRTVLKARLKADPRIVELRVNKSKLFRAIKAESDGEKRKPIKEELHRVSKKLKQRTRRAIESFKKEPAAEIESLEDDDCRRMWKELKTLAG